MIMDDAKKIMNEYDRIMKRQDDLYHDYASKFGLSDISFWILYVLCESDKVYTQNQIADLWHFPRQSINSAVSSLAKQGYISLEKLSAGNSKAIKLTEDGRDFCGRVIDPVFELEERAALKMTDEERKMFVKLSERLCDLLEEEFKQTFPEE